MGSYITEMEATQKEILMACEARDFLAPYFKIDLNNNCYQNEANLPEIRITVQTPRYNYDQKIIWLPLRVKKGNDALGHEIGHWLHSIINPKIFREYTRPKYDRIGINEDFISHLLKESTANYSSVIYINEKIPFKNPEFELLDLATMSTNLSSNLLERIVDFNSHLIRLRKNN